MVDSKWSKWKENHLQSKNEKLSAKKKGFKMKINFKESARNSS